MFFKPANSEDVAGITGVREPEESSIGVTTALVFASGS
jgi:hypothetical protein